MLPTFSPATGLLAELDLLRIEVADSIAHLRLNRPAQALAAARELVALDPDNRRSQRFLLGAQRAARATTPDARIAAIDALPLLVSRQPLRQ